MSRTYVIVDSSELGSVNFDQVLETSADTLRYNLPGTQAVLKFTGDTPSFLEGKTQYSHSEIVQVLQDEEWSESIEPIET